MPDDDTPIEAPARQETVRALLDADTLSTVRGVLLREMIDAARDEAAIPADDTDEG